MTNDKKTDLTICIVSWNSIEILKKCLESIYRFSEGLVMEIIVVDNASSDNTPAIIKREFPGVILIANNANAGFGKANNQAIARSVGRFVLLLNPDILITQACFRYMMEFLSSNREAGCVGCRLMNRDGSIQKSFYRYFPTPFSEFLDGMMVRKIIDKFLFRGAVAADMEVSWIAGACMMFRRDELTALNGFDERFFMYGEDVDLCYRLRKSGKRVFYLSGVEMFHYHGASSGKKAKRYFSTILQRESVYRFMKNHYGRLSAMLYRVLWIVSSITRLSVIVPAYILCLFVMTRYRDSLFYTLQKYYKIIAWCFGFESWVRRQVPE